MSESVKKLIFGEREIILVGTAHVSQESVEEVGSIIRAESPDTVAVELDQGRFDAMQEQNAWEKLDIRKVLKEGRGFLLLANLVLSSYQKRLGENIGVKPGDEMRKAIEIAKEIQANTVLCDREISITLKRAWARCGFWDKSKLMAALVSSAFSSEKLEAEEIERLKNKSELDGMMEELSNYLPRVKEVLIDERDTYLATKIWQAGGQKVVAIVGAGHMDGVVGHLETLATEAIQVDIGQLESLPPASKVSKLAGWIIPLLLILLFGLGFIFSSVDLSIKMLVQWLLLNGSLAAVGTILAAGHPLSVIVSFLGAPIGTLNPFLAVGMFSGLTEAGLRKPRVVDLQNVSEDATSIKGFYKNRITRILLVFFLSSLGGAIGNFIALPSVFKTLMDGLLH